MAERGRNIGRIAQGTGAGIATIAGIAAAADSVLEVSRVGNFNRPAELGIGLAVIAAGNLGWMISSRRNASKEFREAQQNPRENPFHMMDLLLQEYLQGQDEFGRETGRFVRSNLKKAQHTLKMEVSEEANGEIQLVDGSTVKKLPDNSVKVDFVWPDSQEISFIRAIYRRILANPAEAGISVPHEDLETHTGFQTQLEGVSAILHTPSPKSPRMSLHLILAKDLIPHVLNERNLPEVR